MATMSCWRLVALLLFAGLAAAHPLEDDMSISEDTEVVESTVREVRALPPSNFDLEAAGTEYEDSHSGKGKDDIGYLRTHDSKGDKGYQRFNSFHKKGGDSYGFQTESSFGRAGGGDKKGQYHNSGAYSEAKEDGDEQEGAHSGDTDDGSQVTEYEGADSDDNDGKVYYRGHGSEGDHEDYDPTALRGSSDNQHYGEKYESGGRGYGSDDHTALRGNSDNHRYGEKYESGGRGYGSDDHTALRGSSDNQRYGEKYESGGRGYGSDDHTALRGNSDNHRYGEHHEGGGRGYGSHDEGRYGYRQ